MTSLKQHRGKLYMKPLNAMNKIGGYIFYAGLFLSISYTIGYLAAMLFGESLFRGGVINSILILILIVGALPIAALLTLTVKYWNKKLGSSFLKDII